MENKNILFLCSWYPNIEQPTLGNFIQKHAETANTVSNIDVLYAVSRKNSKEIAISDKLINGVRTVIVYYPKTTTMLPLYKSYLKKEAYLKALKVGYNHLNTTYEYVHLNVAFPAGLFALWLNKKQGIPYFITCHWTGYLPQKFTYKNLPFIIRQHYRKIFNRSQLVLPVSEPLKNALKQLNLGKNYRILHNTIDGRYFYPAKLKQSSSEVRFIHISSFDDEHKNVSRMLHVFGKLKIKFHLHIITEGTLEEVDEMLYVNKVNKKNCTVDSQLSPNAIGDALRNADCLVQFSNYETFSIVLAEAWTSGLPAIYTNCGGLTSLNDPKLGIQLKIGDEKALYQALTKFDSTHYSSSSIAEYAERFSHDALVAIFKEVYG